MPIGSYGNSVGSVNGSNIGQIKLERMGDTLNPLANRLNKLENVALKKKEIADQRAYDDGVRADQNQFTKGMQDDRQGFQSGEAQKGRTFQTDERVAGQSYRDKRYGIELKDGIKKEGRDHKWWEKQEGIKQKNAIKLSGVRLSDNKKLAKYKAGLDADSAKKLANIDFGNLYVYSDKGLSKVEKDKQVKDEALRLKSSYSNTVSSVNKRIDDSGIPNSIEVKSLMNKAASGDKSALAKLQEVGGNNQGLKDMFAELTKAKAETVDASTRIKKFSSSLVLRPAKLDMRASAANIEEVKKKAYSSGASGKMFTMMMNDLSGKQSELVAILSKTDEAVNKNNKESVDNLAKSKIDAINNDKQDYKDAVSKAILDGTLDERKKVALKELYGQNTPSS